MRVFGTYGLIDRPSECLYVHTIPLYGCMERCSNYIAFSSQATGKPATYMPPLNNYILMAVPARDHQGPRLFRQLNCLGIPPDQNIILQELGGL